MTVCLYAIKNGAVQVTESDDQSRGFRPHHVSPEIFTFPGGEHHLRNIPDWPEPVTWVADVRGSDPNDLVKAALLANVSRSANFRKRLDDHFVLLIPYLPAARADRGLPLGARVYANFINAVGADRVIALDPHSDVMPSWVHNLQALSPVEIIKRSLDQAGGIIGSHEYTAVIAPDKGATERTKRIADALGLPMYQAHKTRDFDTGHIEKVEVIDALPLAGRYLVVDDICDGGGTFTMLAQHLDDELGIKRSQVGLWVTHGIFSGGAKQLRMFYREIYTTDSHPGHRRVGVATCIEPVWLPLIEHAIAYSRKYDHEPVKEGV